jgi:1,4-dihydroxy-6-naphthoate synthase
MLLKVGLASMASRGYSDRVVIDTLTPPLRQLSLGISPCPNDTFIFHGLVSGIAPADPGFAVSRLVMADVEELNGLAASGELDVVKISLAALADAAPRYRLLTCGGALGRGCGPLLVARAAKGRPASGEPPAAGRYGAPGGLSGAASIGQDIATLALPGARTTAALLAELAGIPGRRVHMRYDEVMPAVARGDVDAGVVIHEGRFTYPALGLELLLDFGAWWEASRNLPLPLGVIAVKRSLGPEAAALVADAIRQSLSHAWEKPEDSREFIARNARELSPEVCAAHIATFVTPFSLDVGVEGRAAITALAGPAFRLAGKGGAPHDLFW